MVFIYHTFVNRFLNKEKNIFLEEAYSADNAGKFLF